MPFKDKEKNREYQRLWAKKPTNKERHKLWLLEYRKTEQGKAKEREYARNRRLYGGGWRVEIERENIYQEINKSRINRFSFNDPGWVLYYLEEVCRTQLSQKN